jgi:hypothetical protein
VTGRILRLLRRFALAVLATATVPLVAVFPAAGKEGVEATLLTKIPLDAPARTRLQVAWRLTYLDHGRRHPFGANGVFVRLTSAAGASAETGFASGNGAYRATVAVPEGGIGDVEIGLQGWTNGAAGTRESDLVFPITNALVARQRARPVRKARLRAQPFSKAQSR